LRGWLSARQPVVTESPRKTVVGKWSEFGIVDTTPDCSSPEHKGPAQSQADSSCSVT